MNHNITILNICFYIKIAFICGVRIEFYTVFCCTVFFFLNSILSLMTREEERERGRGRGTERENEREREREY